MRTYPTRECDRCGEQITAYCPSIVTLSRLMSMPKENFTDPDKYIDEVLKLELVDRALVSEWVVHRALATCKAKVASCK